MNRALKKSSHTTALEQASAASGASRRGVHFGALLIIIATFIVYLPAIQGGFIWDDDSYVTQNPLLRDLNGLKHIWFPGETRDLRTAQYYPVVFTMFWLEYQWWGLNPFGYHLLNVILHIANALLVWRLCVLIGIPPGKWRFLGGWFIAAAFAWHPVHVESVAWITERKNVLSGFFYLAAMLAYVRFDGAMAESASARDLGINRRQWLWYVAGFVLFVLALLSKSVTCSLPAALILVMLYRRVPMSWARLWPLLPWFIVGFVLAMNTAAVERSHVGASGDDFAFSLAERLLIASNALLFYPQKIVWPWPVMFIYPRWPIDASSITQWWPFAVAAVTGIVGLVAYWRGWRGPALAAAFYAGTIFPALGFFNIYPMVFSFVADHFQYLASLGIIVLAAAAFAMSPPRWIALAKACAGIMLVAFAVTSYLQAQTYKDAESVFRDTLSKNPEAWMPHNNLGNLVLDRDPVEAEYHYREAVRIKPTHYPAQSNLVEALRRQGRIDEAILEANRAIEMVRSQWSTKGITAQPSFLATDFNALGRLHLARDERAEAEAAWREAHRLAPGRTEAHLSLAQLFAQQDRPDDAATVMQEVLDAGVVDWRVLRALAIIRQRQERYADAVALYERSLDAASELSEALQVAPPLIRLLATCPDPAVRNVNRALALAQEICDATRWEEPAAMDMLASVLAEASRFEEAATLADRAATQARHMGLNDIASQISSRAQQYRERIQQRR